MFVDHGINPEFLSQGLGDRRALWNNGEQKECETDQMSCRMRVDGQAFDEADQARLQSLLSTESARLCNCHKSLFGHDK
jgi:hypothetical protein